MADRRMNESEERSTWRVLQQALDALPVPIFVKGSDGRYLYANTTLARESGKTKDYFVGKANCELAPPGEAAEMDQEDQSTLSGERVVKRRTVHFENREYSYVITKERLQDTPQGDVLIGCVHDITAVDRMQAELARERDFTSAVLEASGALVVVFDTDARIVRCNRSCEQVTGYSSAELQGKNLWETFVNPAGHDLTKARFQELLTTRTPLFFENEWITKSGHLRRISFSTTVLVDSAGEVSNVIGTGVDITEQHRAQQELSKSEKQFRSLW